MITIMNLLRETSEKSKIYAHAKTSATSNAQKGVKQLFRCF